MPARWPAVPAGWRGYSYSTLAEFSLKNNSRADVGGLDGRGKFIIIEIKTSTVDFRADQKWPEYLDFCDVFYFAVP